MNFRSVAAFSSATIAISFFSGLNAQSKYTREDVDVAEGSTEMDNLQGYAANGRGEAANVVLRVGVTPIPGPGDLKVCEIRKKKRDTGQGPPPESEPTSIGDLPDGEIGSYDWSDEREDRMYFLSDLLAGDVSYHTRDANGMRVKKELNDADYVWIFYHEYAHCEQGDPEAKTPAGDTTSEAGENPGPGVSGPFSPKCPTLKDLRDSGRTRLGNLTAGVMNYADEMAAQTNGASAVANGVRAEDLDYQNGEAAKDRSLGYTRAIRDQMKKLKEFVSIQGIDDDPTMTDTQKLVAKRARSKACRGYGAAKKILEELGAWEDCD